MRRIHQSPVRSANAAKMSKIPTNRNMNPMIDAIAVNVFPGWMKDMIPATIRITASSAFNAFHQPPLTAKTIPNSITPAQRKTMPARIPIVFTEWMLNRNMTSERINQSVPVIRKIHQRLPAWSSYI